MLSTWYDFQHDVTGDFKSFAKRTGSDKDLRHKEFNIAKNPKYDGYKRCLASVVYKCFDKKTKAIVLIITIMNKMNN